MPFAVAGMVSADVAGPGRRMKTGSAVPDAPLLRSGAITFVDAVLDPLIHLVFDPPDAVGAKLYPLGEQTGLLQSGDVLRRVAAPRSHVLLREQFPRFAPFGYGASRRPEG